MAGLLGTWRFNSVWEESASRRGDLGGHCLVRVLSYGSSPFPCELHVSRKLDELGSVATATEGWITA